MSVGACAYQRDAVKTADFLLQIQQDMAEEYPVLNWRGNFAKEVVKQFKKDYQKTEKTIGNFVSETDIPFVSDFYGEFCGVRKKGEKSTAASKLGAFCRGFVVKGAGGTAEGIVKIVMDPLEVAAGVTQILAYPEENVPKIWKEAKRTWEQKAVKGSPEERRILEGQIVFEITSWFIGVGEAKTAAGASKTGDLLADSAKVLDKLGDGAKTMDKLGDGAKVADKLGEGAKVLDKLEDGSKIVNKIGKAKETASTVKQAGKGTGKLNQVKRYKNNLGEYKDDLTKKITQAAEELSGKPGDTLQDIRNGLNRMMGESQPAYAGGSIDKAGDASRAETWYHKSNVMKSEGNTGGVHIGGPKKEGGVLRGEVGLKSIK